MIDVRVLRAAGLNNDQIVAVIQADQDAEAEKRAERREANRQAQIRCRERKRNKINGHVIDVTMTGMTSPPSPPPPNGFPITLPITTPTPPPSHIRVVAKSDPPGNPEFDEFWLAYPKRGGANPKSPARAKFERHVKSGVVAAAIIAGARAYADAEGANVGTPYIAQALTWLNQRRWEDYKPATPKYSPEELAKGREWYARKMAAAL